MVARAIITTAAASARGKKRRSDIDPTVYPGVRGATSEGEAREP